MSPPPQTWGRLRNVTSRCGADIIAKCIEMGFIAPGKLQHGQTNERERQPEPGEIVVFAVQSFHESEGFQTPVPQETDYATADGDFPTLNLRFGQI